MKKINNLVIPDFNSREFKLTPKNSLCEVIDSTRLIVEVLGGLQNAQSEFSESEYSSKIDIDGEFAIVIRYKREKDNKYYPAFIMSFDKEESGNISINQIQGTKSRHVAFRCSSSFNNLAFYLKLIEETFSKRGIYVYVKDIPEGIEGASYASNAYSSYNILRTAMIGLNKKYGLERKL